MYSEIKSTDTILINRLDENEKLLLEEIYNDSKISNTKVTLEKLTDESGDFGGVFVQFERIGDTQDMTIISDPIPEVYLTKVGDTTQFVIETDVPDNKCNVIFGTDNYSEDSHISMIVEEPNVISFTADKSTEEPVNLYYSIFAEGYNTINGKITVDVEDRELVPVQLNIKNVDEELISDALIIISDSKDTVYEVTYENDLYTAYLPVDTFKLEISKEGYSNYTEEFIITEDDLSIAQSIYKNITLELQEESTENT